MSTVQAQETKWDTVYEWKAVTLLTLGFGLVGLDRWIIAPLLPMMMKDLHLDPQDVGNILGVLGIAWGLFAVITGHLSDRLGRRKVLIPAMIAFSLLSAFSGLVTGLASLLLIRALMGVTEGAFCPSSFAATNDASLPARRGRNQGIQQCAFALFGLGFGPIIATQLLNVLPSWRWVFLVVGVPGLILSVVMWKVIRDRAQGASDSPAAQGDVTGDLVSANVTGSIFGHRNVLLGMLAQFCAVMGMFVLAAFMPIYLSDYLHMTPAAMGFVLSALGFGGALGMFGLPTASD
nr:MFS transporter [Solimonas marina]